MDIVEEQKAYYDARAAEYDEWWFRSGRYALGPEAKRHWLADVAEAEAALREFAPGGDVLELACGTGLWTHHLVRHAGRVTAVDASAEMIARNRLRVGGGVTYVRADVFAWTPPAHRFDVCFFSYWLSHVPDDRLAPFWATVADALRPGGRVFLVDSHHPSPLPGHTQERVLNDGRHFTVVKRFWRPAELAAHAATAGFALDVHVTTHGAILHASGCHTGS
ncbi:MAG TPA: class I SAM-dependent methyltransferase [Actinophytocola sp.]|jgi:demethylmenaquinone methyltransferase/2-methoxy-6-polyprenyl-1,4-benzoquinol methylase|nr:class I SAM-dependent methyltransferase [Actinophytocola sp.]